jgi:hypothetical protein
VGFGKSMKDMKDMMAAAPDLIQQAQDMQAAASAQAAAAQGAMASDVDPALLEPIEGISLELYARFAKTIGERGLDEAGTKAMVEKAGHTAEQWKAAYDGWNARFKGNMNLSTRFGMLYQQAEAM